MSLPLPPPDPWLVNGHHYQCSFIQTAGLTNCDCRGPAAPDRLPLQTLIERVETVAKEARYFQQSGMWVNLDRTHADLLEQAAWYLRQFAGDPRAADAQVPESGPVPDSGAKELPAFASSDDDIIDAEIVEDE